MFEAFRRFTAKPERVRVLEVPGNEVPVPLFDAWVRHLGPNPKQGQDCPDGFWWEDVCWHARVTRAQRILDRELANAGETRRFRVYEDESGVYRAVEETARG
jgi:hypothetical protein